VSTAPLLYELHDMARERGIEGYRRMSKDELWDALEAVPEGPTEVGYESHGALGVLTIRGGRENRLSLEALEGLADEVERLAGEPEVRVVAITGAGRRIFSGGADLDAVGELDGAQVTGRGSRACDRIAAAAVPTVALLNGHAVGGAIDLALACDWRLAAPGIKLRFIHNELGYCPPWGGAQRLGRLLPAGVALRLFATCELISSDEARSLGIVDAVVPGDRLIDRAEALASRVERAGREAVAATKALLVPGAAVNEHEAVFAQLWDQAKLEGK
jgi:enoyl-CoA hydratase/carnithine racemase